MRVTAEVCSAPGAETVTGCCWGQRAPWRKGSSPGKLLMIQKTQGQGARPRVADGFLPARLQWGFRGDRAAALGSPMLKLFLAGCWGSCGSADVRKRPAGRGAAVTGLLCLFGAAESNKNALNSPVQTPVYLQTDTNVPQSLGCSGERLQRSCDFGLG